MFIFLAQFPIASYWSRSKHCHVKGWSIPWDMLTPHEKQALDNHCGQTLKRLAERGGFAACEAIAVLEDRRWTPMDPEKATEILKQKVEKYLTNLG